MCCSRGIAQNVFIGGPGKGIEPRMSWGEDTVFLEMTRCSVLKSEGALDQGKRRAFSIEETVSTTREN